jgi:hypothetical protein
MAPSAMPPITPAAMAPPSLPAEAGAVMEVTLAKVRPSAKPVLTIIPNFFDIVPPKRNADLARFPNFPIFRAHGKVAGTSPYGVSSAFWARIAASLGPKSLRNCCKSGAALLADRDQADADMPV